MSANSITEGSSKTIIQSVNVDALKEALRKIDWSIKGDYPNAWIWDHNGNRTSFWVTTERIEQRLFDEKEHSVNFYFNGAQIVIWNNCVSVGTEHCFVQFYNHQSVGGN